MKKELAELQEELSQAHNQVWKIHFHTNCIFWFPVFTTSGYSGWFPFDMSNLLKRVFWKINGKLYRKTFPGYCLFLISIKFISLVPIQQVHISETRVSAALDKLAYMEELVNDRLLQERSTVESECTSSSASTSTGLLDTPKSKQPRRTLNVSGPVQDYSSRLKNFWYPVAFSADLKNDTMVSQLSHICQSLSCLKERKHLI